MKNVNRYREFCNGCGICHAVQGVKFAEDARGFSVPDLEGKDSDFFESVCPILSKEKYPSAENKSDWGDYEKCYLGYSGDEMIRFVGSSGGVLTSLAIYLLESKRVDAIIQIGKDPECAYKTKVFCSRTKEEVLSCAGSRYSISSPLYSLQDFLATDETYCFIGKPCDVQALFSYCKKKKDLEEKFPYLLSFFCAGMPSVEAQRKLLSRLQCEKDCVDLDYRGNGWPGYTIATNSKGNKYQVDYKTSWSSILGRDVRKSCRFCYDGIGLFADIVCADAWYMNADGTPDFSEHNGRNAIIVRNKKGNELLKAAQKNGYVVIEDYDINRLNHIQSYQHDRRGTMLAKKLAMSLFLRSTPKFDYRDMYSQSKTVGMKRQFIIFGGTIKRILKKRI